MNPQNQTPSKSNPPVNFYAFDSMPRASKAWLLLCVPPIIAFIALCVAGVIQAGGYQGPSSGNGGGGWTAALFICGFLMFGSGIGMYVWQQSKRQKAAFAAFVMGNGWTLAEAGSLDNVATSLLGAGRDQQASQAFDGEYQGRPFHGLVYQYTTGSGKSQETHTFANLYFELSQAFPLIVLDNKSGQLFGLFSDLPDRIPNGKPLQLEGDFNEHYRVTVLPGTEQEVLQFMTPDFMSELLQAPKQADIEIEGDKLFIIASINDGNLSADFNGPTLKELFAASDIVLKHLGEVAFSWQASSSPDAVASMAATALAPRTKVMFGRRHVGITGIAGILVYAGFNILSSLGLAGLQAFAAVAIVVLALAVLGYTFWRLRQQD
jgi:hypothetical protein